LIEVRLRVADGFGEILAEAREILLVAAASCSNDYAVGSRQFIQEWRAGGRSVNDGQGTVERLQPERQLGGRHVRASEVEASFFAVEGPVPDQHQPEFIRPIFRFRGKRLLQPLKIVGLAAGINSQRG